LLRGGRRKARDTALKQHPEDMQRGINMAITLCHLGRPSAALKASNQAIRIEVCLTNRSVRGCHPGAMACVSEVRVSRVAMLVELSDEG